MLIGACKWEALPSHITGRSCEPCNRKLIRAVIGKLMRANIEKLYRAINREAHESQLSGSS
ncbi:hypothetical protein F383_04280 [Gossypium arboreum]|uniref:Uncharacterized protein n=1 Tax=Gossypium arboreum TaxID=29729 RepID=A0A0B0NFQ7_GOSAR|nr:hypothetical protein F383_04280 [Gossypium arboreum]